jgi:1-acyl-sn-glycerol-3-phosphate acyltransferase
LSAKSLELPPSIPARGNWFSRGLGRLVLSTIGWKIDGGLPDYPKMVVIVAPHTSNWDFPLGVAGLFALGVKLTFLAKHSLFKPPLGYVMRWLGGVPVKRVVREDTVAIEIGEFRRNDRWVLALAPEGTRKYVEHWRSGFYHVAMGAPAPIIPVGFDYSTKTIRIMPAFVPTGDYESDLQLLKGLYNKKWALKPENFRDLDAAPVLHS